MTLEARHIRAARALVGATQEDVARAAGLSLATLNNIEREIARPRRSTLDKIVRALADAGVEVFSEGGVHRVTFETRGQIRDEPGTPTRDTFRRLMGKDSLLCPVRGIFFCYMRDYHRCGFALEGTNRRVLYTERGLDARHRVGLADLAATALIARKQLKGQVFFVGDVQSREAFVENPYAVFETTGFAENLSEFLGLFSEAQDIIHAAAGSDQHPLHHVIKALR